VLAVGYQLWRLSLLDRYVVQQLLLVVLFGLLLFTIIWLAPETLFKLTGLLFDGKLTPQQFGLLILYDLPNVLMSAIPMAVLFGSIIVFRQFSLNFELVNFFNAGIGLFRLMQPVLLMGLVFSLLHFGLQEWVIPETAPVFDALRQSVGLKSERKLNFTFVEKNHAGQWQRLMLVENIENYKKNGILEDFLIVNYAPDAKGGVYIADMVTAKTGQWSPESGVWILNKGRRYQLDEEGVYRNNQPFQQYAFKTNDNPIDLLKASLNSPKHMPLDDLSRYIRLLRRGNQLQDVHFYEVRLWQKVAFPLASICFAVMGALLGMEPIRSRNHYALTFGALILFLYSVLIPFTSNFGSLGIVDPWVVVSFPLLAALILGTVLFNVRRAIEKV